MRYAFDGSTKVSEVIEYDVVIIGAGIAGIYSALHIDERLSCCILAKESIDISNSWFAQGGIAAAMSTDDTPKLHLDDTLIAGAGLCDEKAVRVLVDEGPKEIAELVERGVPFDLSETGELSITREGGHRKNRILHAGGDATGKETVKALAALAAMRPNITFFAQTCFIDILTNEAGAVGGILVRRHNGTFQIIVTANVVISTGGIGQVYKKSTNPSVATGDGIAAALRAGARAKNMEFIQFHPTGLWSPEVEAREFLISEAVRGEGGLLLNAKGIRFMEGAHELNELAPRDIVARAIFKELRESGEEHVYIDITSKSEEFLEHRFPTIFNECLSRGINIAHDKIPVWPVQHYLMGGIETDLEARTLIPGLYACGEAAYTGVHGANRLASNSMLECLVFGHRAADNINANYKKGSATVRVLPDTPTRANSDLNFSEIRANIQSIMDEYGFIVRTKEGLETARRKIEEIKQRLEAAYDDGSDYLEVLNIATVALVIIEEALARPESIGSHYIEN